MSRRRDNSTARRLPRTYPVIDQSFCPHCGTKRPEWARFCASCGKGYDAPPAANPQAIAEAPPTATAAQASVAAKSPRPVKLLATAAILILLVVMAVGWLGSQKDQVTGIVATATGWTLDRAQSFATGNGFTGQSSPLANGTPRWLANRSSDGALFEAIGTPTGLTTISLVLPVNTDNATALGDLLSDALSIWLLGSQDWVAAEVVSIIDSGGDISKSFAGGAVRLQGLPMSDGTLLTVTITRG